MSRRLYFGTAVFFFVCCGGEDVFAIGGRGLGDVAVGDERSYKSRVGRKSRMWRHKKGSTNAPFP